LSDSDSDEDPDYDTERDTNMDLVGGKDEIDIMADDTVPKKNKKAKKERFSSS